MSKHSCYIENSQEAREWLALIGLLSNVEDYQSSDILTVYHGSSFGLKDWNIGFLLNDDSFTDCRGNLPLFKALTAVRDDSDYMQEFTDGINWVLCEAETVRVIALCHFINNDEKVLHKATKKQLIEHFK